MSNFVGYARVDEGKCYGEVCVIREGIKVLTCSFPTILEVTNYLDEQIDMLNDFKPAYLVIANDVLANTFNFTMVSSMGDVYSMVAEGMSRNARKIERGCSVELYNLTPPVGNGLTGNFTPSARIIRRNTRGQKDLHMEWDVLKVEYDS